MVAKILPAQKLYLEYDDMGNLILEQYFWDDIPAATTSYSYNEDGG